MANIKYCSECGQKVEEGVKFCPNCGKALLSDAAREVPQSNVYTPDYTPGFSSRINNPEILAATEKNRKRSGKFLLFLLPLPIIGFSVYALITKEMKFGQAFIIGAVISLIILIINLMSRSSHSAKNTYEAEVIDKRYEYTRNNDESAKLVYRTIVRTSDGRKKVIEETSNPPRSAYEYLNVGDRFRYHPQLAFPYEKYDKSKDGFVYCACCTVKNDLCNDRCQKCGVPLLK